MINLDLTSTESSADEIYSVERRSKVRVFLDGGEIKGCVYCNTTKGFAICVKRELSGALCIFDDAIVYEIVFGDLTVVPVIDDFEEMAERFEQKRKLNGKATNHEIEL